MNALSTTFRRLLLILAVLGLSTGASCSLSDDRTIDFAFTGRVLDADTKAPIEGAFVLAVYEKVDLGMAGSARYCIKTKGMVTGKDGAFSFPIERLDNRSPGDVFAIKADYYLSHLEHIPIRVQQKTNKESNSNRNVYLKKQDPAKPEFRYGYRQCERPLSAQAVEANIDFLRINRGELVKLGKAFEWYEKSLQTIDEQIADLQTTHRN
jgi:hypothetical protein